MTNLKKLGLTALAGSLVATTGYAGELGISGSAKVSYTGGDTLGVTGNPYSMSRGVTFSGSGELDNGMTVALSFVIDQGDDEMTSETSPFDSHSVTVSSDALGSLKFSGEGGSSATSALDTTAAGDIWDAYDIASTVHPTGIGGGSNSMLYTLPALMDGLSVNASFNPSGTGTESAMGYSATYTGVEGLSISYGSGDGTTANTSADAMKASYAYGPVTVAYSSYEYDADGSTSDDDTTAYKVSYTVSDEISLSYGTETITRPTKEDVETSRISASYTAGGMTITATMDEIENMDGSTTATQDRERWALGASFAF